MKLFKNSSKGFTLVELMLVIALGSMILVSAIVLYSKVRDSAVTDKMSKDVHAILGGLSELRLYKGAIPAAAGPAWPAGTDAYVDVNTLQAAHGYSCATGVLKLTLPPADDANQAARILTKLSDQALCTSTAGSPPSSVTGTKVTCVVVSFNGNAGCP